MPDCNYVHLNYPPTSGWVIRLINVLLNSRSEVQERLTTWWTREEVYEIALALASKLEMVRVVARRLDERLQEIGKALLERPDEILECLRENSACLVRRDDLLLGNAGGP